MKLHIAATVCKQTVFTSFFAQLTRLDNASFYTANSFRRAHVTALCSASFARVLQITLSLGKLLSLSFRNDLFLMLENNNVKYENSEKW